MAWKVGRLKKIKCEHCGAPLTPDESGLYRCEYCGSVYQGGKESRTIFPGIISQDVNINIGMSEEEIRRKKNATLTKAILATAGMVVLAIISIWVMIKVVFLHG